MQRKTSAENTAKQLLAAHRFRPSHETRWHALKKIVARWSKLIIVPIFPGVDISQDWPQGQTKKVRPRVQSEDNCTSLTVARRNVLLSE